MKQLLFSHHRIVLILGGLVAGLAARTQAPAWQAAVALTAPGTGSAYANAVATDAAGNVYVAGQFNGTLSLGTFTLTSPGSGNNGFVAKWSPATQQFSWARQVGGSVTGVAVVGTSVYATGYFFNTAAFGTTTLTSAGDYDVFVVKLLDTGTSNTLAWVRQAGGAGSDRAEAIAATSSAVYVAGQFTQAATFGTTALTGSGTGNAFVAKLTDGGSTGTFAWAQPVATTGYSNAYGLAATGSTVYLTGQFSQTATFGNVSLSTTASNTAYVAKLLDAGPTGSFAWAQAPAGTGSSYALGVAAAGQNVYVAGRFSGTNSFGTQALTSVGFSDMYVAKLADGGSQSSFVWTQRAGGPDDEGAQKVAVAGSQVYVAGSFRGTVGFGSTSLISSGAGDVFVSKLTDNGPSATFDWTQQAGGPGNDSGRAIALAGAAPVVVGSFNATASFGNQLITNASTFSENAFLALLAPQVLATAPPAAALHAVVFPNPARATATVRVPGSGPAILTLLDGLGRPVRTQATAAGTNCLLDLTGLAPGVYALRVQASEAVATQKLVVE